MLHTITCSSVAGCDGDHGITRTAVPDGVLTAHTLDHGIGWLAALADAPPNRPFGAYSLRAVPPVPMVADELDVYSVPAVHIQSALPRTGHRADDL
ncbi:hypothetical protein GCM10010129_07820 [Streptomyces fumigatiscleroticus]|nr:hypothetical protein GCM10010129_07820 [Streptomyces fumigatiscleroticus]